MALNSFELITKYLPDSFDSILAQKSKTQVLVNSQNLVDVNFKQAGYIKVSSMLIDGFSDYKRAGSGDSTGYKKGGAKTTWEIMKVDYDRAISIDIDEQDDEESAGLLMAKTLTEFQRTRAVPEIDAIRFSRIASKTNANLGNYVTETIGANEIISKFENAFEWFEEHEVDPENQVLFVTPAINKLIRNTTELEKRITQEDLVRGNITQKVRMYDGREIIVVPSNRFFTNLATSENGYTKTDSSKAINYMIVDKTATVPVVKVEKAKVYDSSVITDFDGYRLNVHISHDLLIPKNKVLCAYVSVSESAPTVNKLYVASEVGDTETTVSAFYTSPAGLNGNLVYATAGQDIGDTITGSTAVEIGTAFTNLTTEAYYLVDSDNKILAKA